MKIKAQFTIFSTIAIMVIAMAAAINYFTLRHLIVQAEQAQTASILLRQHLDGDMMHDAIRADVLKATLGLKSGDARMIEGARREASEHGARFLDNLRKNLALDLPADIHDLFRQEEPALKAYTEQAAAVIDVAMSDARNGGNRTDGLLPAFEAAFGVLEEAQAGISDKINAFSSKLRDRQVGAASAAETYALALAVLTVLITSCIPAFTGRTLFAPQARLMEAMRELAAGAVEIDVPFAGRTDEIGHMAAALTVFQRNAKEKIRLEREREEEKKAEEALRREAMLDLADGFERRIGELVRTMVVAATELRTTAESMSTVSRHATDRAGSVAAASEQTARNSNMVAAATEKLSASFSEINERMANSTTIIEETVAQAKDTSATVKGLDDVARKIGEVVKLIGDVAEQTNLLALNATIEAARAGSAGKGFAVVAAEVKALANQTAKATEEVEKQIRAIQLAVRSSTIAMDGVSESIVGVSDISTAIAGAVQEQVAATVGIASNIAEASRGASEIRTNISGVLQAAQEAGNAASQVLAAAGALSRNGEALTAELNEFLREIRAA